MSKTVNHLSVPPMDLTITEAGNGKLKVELNVPRTSGSSENIPFLEVTRNEQQTLLNGARQTVISRLSRSGFQIGDIEYEQTAGANIGAGAGGGANVQKLGKVSFEISAGASGTTTVNGSIRNNPDVAGAIREAETGFDTRRQDMYEQRAREWYRQGGATLTSNGETYRVTPDAAKTYINQRHPLNPFERVSLDGDGATDGAFAFSGNPHLERQFQQALSGIAATSTPNQRDAAALAVEAISSTPGYAADGDVSVVSGSKGNLIVFQGQDASGVRASVPDAKPGDFERVADQLAKVPTVQVAQEPEQPDRSRTQAV